MGLLIFVWGIYTELQNCMYQMATAPAFPNHWKGETNLILI
jgi:hypothetical protein